MKAKLCMRKFLWQAAMVYKSKVKEDNTLFNYMESNHLNPKSVFSIRAWDKWVQSEEDLKKLRKLHKDLDDLIYKKVRMFG